MKVLIAGGTGFMGSALRRRLEAGGHQVWVLTRRQPRTDREVRWDGRMAGDWTARLCQMDGVVNLAGYSLEHWPWTRRRKQRFLQSRVAPGTALTQAILSAKEKPRVLVQISGVNYYGATGESVADETSPPGGDFLARLAVEWEAATRPVEQAGVRRVVARTAVVLDRRAGLFPLMALPVRLWMGGPFGTGRQAVPWIHVDDYAEALKFLLEDQRAHGVFNLVAPQPTSNAGFMRAVARASKRPYWFPTPAWLLRLVLGEMGTLVVDGRYSQPARLTELGFTFRYPTIEAALRNLFARPGVS